MAAPFYPLILLSVCRMRCVCVVGELCAALVFYVNYVAHRTLDRTDFKGDTYKLLDIVDMI